MVASGIVTEINRGLDIKTEVLNTITVENFTKDIAARVRLISSLILWGVIFVTAPPDEPSGDDAKSSLELLFQPPRPFSIKSDFFDTPL